MKTSEVSLVDLLRVVSKRCEKESSLYHENSNERIRFISFLDDIEYMIAALKEMEKIDHA